MTQPFQILIFFFLLCSFITADLTQYFYGILYLTQRDRTSIMHSDQYLAQRSNDLVDFAHATQLLCLMNNFYLICLLEFGNGKLFFGRCSQQNNYFLVLLFFRSNDLLIPN